LAKRTVETKYQDSDIASGVHRRLLSLKLDAKEIYYEEDKDAYERDPRNVEIPAEDAVKEVSDVPLMATAATSQAVPLTSQQRPMLPSAPMTLAEVVRAIVAIALKVPISRISMENNTIKDLAGGSS